MVDCFLKSELMPMGSRFLVFPSSAHLQTYELLMIEHVIFYQRLYLFKFQMSIFLLPLVHQSSAAFLKVFSFDEHFVGGFTFPFQESLYSHKRKDGFLYHDKKQKGWNKRKQRIILCFIPGLPETFSGQSMDIPYASLVSDI